MSIHPVANSSETVASLDFNLYSDEVLLEIFLTSIRLSFFEEAKTTYFSGRLACRRFKKVFDDPKILAALLEKGHNLPLSFIRKIPGQGIYAPLLKSTYEHLLSDRLKGGGRVSDALPFLENLDEGERARITYASLSGLAKPSYAVDEDSQKKWMEDLSRFFKLLPCLQTIRLPSQPNQFPSLFRVLSPVSGQIMGIEMQFWRAESDLTATAAQFPKLRSIFIANCEQASNASLQFIFDKHPEITAITLLDTPNIQFEHVTIPDSLNLKKITLRGTNFTGKATAFLFKCFPNLESLSLGGTSNDEKAITEILQSSLSLKELDLSHLPVKDSHFREVFPLLSKSLRRLTLYGCPFITSEGIESIRCVFPHLEHLDVRFCQGLSG